MVRRPFDDMIEGGLNEPAVFDPGGGINEPAVFEPDESHAIHDDFSLRAARHRARQNPSVGMIYPLHLRNHPSWSGNNEFGYDLAYAPNVDNRQMVLKLGEWGPPEVWSVMLSLGIPETADANFAVIAEVQSGSGGTVDEYEIDWNEGATFTTVCNSLVINARFDAGSGDIPDGLKLKAIVGRGHLDGTNPTRTIVTAALTADVVVIPIPKYATKVTLLQGSGGGASGAYNTNMLYTFARGNGVTGSIASLTGLNFFQIGSGAKIDIPGSANTIQVTNTTGAPVFFTLVFELGL